MKKQSEAMSEVLKSLKVLGSEIQYEARRAELAMSENDRLVSVVNKLSHAIASIRVLLDPDCDKTYEYCSTEESEILCGIISALQTLDSKKPALPNSPRAKTN